jgi:hypothetical protein
VGGGGVHNNINGYNIKFKKVVLTPEIFKFTLLGSAGQTEKLPYIRSGKESNNGNSNHRGKNTNENAAFKDSVEVHRDSPPREKRECEGATRKVSGKIQRSYDTREKTGS